jgi:hypothetical protein
VERASSDNYSNRISDLTNGNFDKYHEIAKGTEANVLKDFLGMRTNTAAFKNDTKEDIKDGQRTIGIKVNYDYGIRKYQVYQLTDQQTGKPTISVSRTK